MTTMFRVCAALAVAAFFSTSVEDAQARPKYRTVFAKKYTTVAKNHKITCFVCHGKNDEGKLDKEKRNDYAKALGKALGKKNESDNAKIDAGLGKIESEKSGVEGKTYGDLLKAGELPK